jgi:hypothetical protein
VTFNATPGVSRRFGRSALGTPFGCDTGVGVCVGRGAFDGERCGFGVRSGVGVGVGTENGENPGGIDALSTLVDEQPASRPMRSETASVRAHRKALSRSTPAKIATSSGIV